VQKYPQNRLGHGEDDHDANERQHRADRRVRSSARCSITQALSSPCRRRGVVRPTIYVLRRRLVLTAFIRPPGAPFIPGSCRLAVWAASSGVALAQLYAVSGAALAVASAFRRNWFSGLRHRFLCCFSGCSALCGQFVFNASLSHHSALVDFTALDASRILSTLNF
jgi:hypothetical protein